MRACSSGAACTHAQALQAASWRLARRQRLSESPGWRRSCVRGVPAGSHEPAHGPCYVWINNFFDRRRVCARLVRHSCRFRGSDSRTRNAAESTNLAPNPLILARARESESSHEPYGTCCRVAVSRAIFATAVGGYFGRDWHALRLFFADTVEGLLYDTARCVIDAVRGDRSVWRLGRCQTFLRVGHGMSTTWTLRSLMLRQHEMPHSASRGRAVGNANPDNPLKVAAHMSVNADAKTALGLLTTCDESESRIST